MSDPVRWGVLGASKFAREHMARALHAAEGAEFAALATFDRAKAVGFQAFCHGLKVHGSYEDLLADPEIEAVYIPLPNHLHVPMTKMALRAGKHVLCEKPIALKAGDIDDLIALRDASGLFASEAYMIVHHPQWQRARDLLRDGAIGTLRHVEGIFTYDNSGDPGNVRNKAEFGGGGIPDIGVYTYGATRWMTGEEPDEISWADVTFENGVDVVAHVAARFPSFTAHWINAMRMHPAQEMTFHGDKGLIRLTAPFNPNTFGEARVELHRNAKGQLSTIVERFPAANHYVNQVEAVCRTIREGAACPWTLEDARGTQAVIDAVFAKVGKVG